MVLALSAQGHRVFALARRVEGVLAQVAGEREGVFACEMDVESEESVKNGARTIQRIAGGLDAVVSNAGVLSPADRTCDVRTMQSRDLEAMLRVNVVGAARVIRYFDPLVRDRGLFATVTSEAGSISNPFPGLPGYSISKAAENKLVSIQAVTVTRYRVLAIHPGRVDTDMGHESAQISPTESARGICALITGEQPVPPEYGWFVDYLGRPMPH